MWLLIKSGPEETVEEIAPGVNVELGKKGELLGIEILDASKVLGSKLGLKSTNKSNYTAATAHKIR